MTTQWEILGKNCSISVSHSNDNSQLFSSIERFSLYDKSNTSPIESITFNFSFLVKLPEMRCDEKHSAQHYNITVRIISKVVMYNEKPIDMPLSLLKMFGDSTIIAEIEYVDYNIARSILATLDSWANEIEQSSNSKLLEFAQGHSVWIPRITKLATLFAAINALIFNAGKYANSYTIESSIKYCLISIGIIYTALKIGEYLGRYSVSKINSLAEISYININIGDKRSIDTFNKNNILSIIKTCISTIISVIQIIFTELISTNIVNIVMRK
jgi:hypothetical protein